MKKSIRNKLTFSLLGTGVLFSFLYFQNNALITSEHELTSDKLPETFDQFKIAHLSDLHNKSFGSNQKKLIKKIHATNPNIVVITGDIIDARRYDAKPSITLVRELSKSIPVYYVPGNHEARSGNFTELKEVLIDAGAHVLQNNTEKITIDNNHILISGIDDPAFNPASSYIDDTTYLNDQILTALENISDSDTFHMLLSHRPEALELYTKHNFDAVFSGHAHGGQIRLPFIGGLIAPNQGFLPSYTAGKHTRNNTAMFISRGLGNSLFPFRIFNRPEIPLITLEVSK